MGVQARVWIEAPAGEEPRAREAAARAFARLAELEQSMSDYRDTSEIAQLARAGGGEAVPISADLARVLGVALNVARASGGAFDPTVGHFRSSGARPTHRQSPEPTTNSRVCAQA